MDLPSCPACGQSVLEDDAQECPFCGSPMKGAATAGGKPKAPPPKKSAIPPVAGDRPLPAVQRPSAGKSVAGKPAAEDPFAVESVDTSAAIKLVPAKTKSRTFEVRCPMCESTGFAVPSAAGKLVRCVNEQCLMPVFSAPGGDGAPTRPVAATRETPRAPLSNWVYIGGGTGVAVVLLGIAWLGFNSWMSAQQAAVNKPIEMPIVARPAADPAGTGDASTDPPAGTDAVKRNNPATVTAADKLDKARQEWLGTMLERTRTAPVSRRPGLRRVAALSYAHGGDWTSVDEQMKQLETMVKDGNDAATESIPPLVALAWKQRADAATKDLATATIAKAKERSLKLSPRGRPSVDAAIGLAALLVVENDLASAKSLIDRARSATPALSLAASAAIVSEEGSYDLAQSLPAQPAVGTWHYPLEVAVTVVLVLKRHDEEARQWANACTPDAARQECGVAWCEALARRAGPALDDATRSRVMQEASRLDKPARARVLARLALQSLRSGDTAKGDENLAQAIATFSSIETPAAIEIASIRDVLSTTLPSASQVALSVSAALAIADAAHASGKLDVAWNHVARACEFVATLAPPTSVSNPHAAANPSRVDVQKALKLKTDEEGRLALVTYKQKSKELAAASKRRFVWTTDLLVRAASSWKLESQVWTALTTGPADSVLKKDKYLEGHTLPALVIALADSPTRALMKSELDKQKIPTGSPELRAITIRRQVDVAPSGGNEYGTAAKLIGKSPAPEIEELTVRLACELVRAGKLAEARQFINGIEDTYLREEAAWLTGGLAGRLGRGTEYWGQFDGRNSEPLTVAHLAAGLATGTVPPREPVAGAE